jgi:hypothetical protein
MRSQYLAIKTDIIEQIAYLPALCKLALQEQKYGKSKNRTGEPRLVVSMTSFPARFGKLHNCIRSLLSQKLPPEKVVLYLTRQECDGIRLPRRLLALQARGLEIRTTDVNLRSLNKIYHALIDFPHHTIVTCDDDKLYPGNWLEGLVRTHNLYPGQIICNRSRKISFDTNGDLASYRSWPSGKAEGPSRSAVPLGVGGVLYPANSLDACATDVDLYRKLCPTSDDLWLKAMAMLRQTMCVQVAGESGVYPSVPFWNGPKLSPENIWQDGNNLAMKALMQHFNWSAADFLDDRHAKTRNTSVSE